MYRFAALFVLFSQLSSAADFPIGQKLQGAKESVYTQKVIDLIREWPPQGMGTPAAAGIPFWIEAIRTDGNSDYIGLRKRVFIHAPVAAVKLLVEDYNHYPEIYSSDLKDIHVTSHDANQTTTSWERGSPVFFLGHVHYEQVYVSEETSQGKFYRYQLKSGNYVNFSDGVIVIEPAPEGTYVSSYDFFEGNFGLAKILAEGKIWKDALEGYVRADLSLKEKAENPSWTAKQIEVKADQLIDQYRLNLEQTHYLSSLSAPVPITPTPARRLPANTDR